MPDDDELLDLDDLARWEAESGSAEGDELRNLDPKLQQLIDDALRLLEERENDPAEMVPVQRNYEGESGLKNIVNALAEVGEEAEGKPQVENTPEPEEAEPINPTDSTRISLTDNEYTILRALRLKRPRRVMLADLAADTSIDRKVCGQVVTSLIERGLAERLSPRTGATITAIGEELIREADAPRRSSDDAR